MHYIIIVYISQPFLNTLFAIYLYTLVYSYNCIHESPAFLVYTHFIFLSSLIAYYIIIDRIYSVYNPVEYGEDPS